MFISKFKATLLFGFSLLAIVPSLSAQATFVKVYDIMQAKCVSCHGETTPAAGLNLVGSGANVAAKQQSVYNSLYKAVPTNTASKNKGHQRIYPGRADKSLMFRKINHNNFEPTIVFDAAEGAHDYPVELTNVETELVRQWMLFGAPLSGQVMNDALLNSYYNVAGLKAFPDGPPAPPSVGEGFQIKMGPYYLPPGGELEYFQKWETDIPEDLEVTRVDVIIADYSHHFIIYDFKGNEGELTAAGLRPEPNHNNIGLVTAVQGATDLKLPPGTAFQWIKDIVLDLNSHYINYSNDYPYQAEAYVNIYTQPKGKAKQVMYSSLIPNVSIFIPNNGNPVTFEQAYSQNIPGNLYLWGLMGHTHKYGTDYKIYKRNINGSKAELLYDASCAEGVPGCASPYFDYKHIPLKLEWPLLPLPIKNGFIHQATYINDGPSAVWFGATSHDEMMVMIAMYTLDTTGLGNLQTAVNEPFKLVDEIKIAPNPTEGTSMLWLPNNAMGYQVQVIDPNGRVHHAEHAVQNQWNEIPSNKLSPGLYFVQITDEGSKKKAVQKLVVL